MEQLDWFLWNLTCNDFSKLCRENSSFIKIGQEQPVLYMKTCVQLWHLHSSEMLTSRYYVIRGRRCFETAKRSHLQGPNVHCEKTKTRKIIELLPLPKFHSRFSQKKHVNTLWISRRSYQANIYFSLTTNWYGTAPASGPMKWMITRKKQKP
jgi:hypothetical protein